MPWWPISASVPEALAPPVLTGLAYAPEAAREKIRVPAILLAMHNDPATEWRRLAEHYRGLGEEELLLLVREFGDLTESAQQALRAELQTRGLGNPERLAQQAQNPTPARSSSLPRANQRESSGDLSGSAEHNASEDEAGADESETEATHDYTWKVVLCDCEEWKQAWQLGQALSRAGIDNWPESSDRRGGERYSRVQVAADQLDQARMIASQPIPRDIVDESNEDPDEYAPPVCPGCGAADPVLESADPMNLWHCEVCGRDWTEAVDSEGESSTKTSAGAPPKGVKDRVSSFFGFGRT
jgi:hypothetical protein